MDYHREPVYWIPNRLIENNTTGSAYEEAKTGLVLTGVREVQKARDFHRSIPEYQETPLRDLRALAKRLGVGGVYVKDESYRFGLNSFKALGGSYAIARYAAEQMEKNISDMTWEDFTSDAARKKIGQITFFTATDGNHGRGVAWAARQLGQKCVVYMPKGTSPARLENIRKEGALVEITDLNYDDTIRMTAKAANSTPNSVIVQDTSWEGYEKIPTWIMQGYGVMAMEADEQLAAIKQRPTHVFVQAGVGSMAASVQGYFADRYKDAPPRVTVVEAAAADCFYRSAMAGDGKPHIVSGDMDTIMAGLACGEPYPMAWEIFKSKSDGFASCPDWVTKLGMRILAAPLSGDPIVKSGESGAVTTGLLAALMLLPDQMAEYKAAMGLNEQSRILVFSTEGDTDPARYRQIIWGI